jgi:hypothetical protein
MDMTLREAKKQVFLELASHFETWDEATQDKALAVMTDCEALSSQEKLGLDRGLQQFKEGKFVNSVEMETWFKAHS